MGRIRTIKPDFAQSESIGRLSRDARLLFVQLWTIVDDEGRARATARLLASSLYPYDDDAPNLIEGWLCELERQGMVRRYQVEGSTYLEVTNWRKHQKIERKTASKFPAFDEGSPSPHRALTDPSPPDMDMDMEVDEDTRASARAAAANSLEAECRGLVGQEPVLLAQDFHVIEKLLADGGVTREDVLAGIRSAMAEPNFRIRHWRQLAGWARGAARDRLGGRGKTIQPAAPPPEPVSPEVWRRRLEKFASSEYWPGSYGPRPGMAGCAAPPELVSIVLRQEAAA